MQLSKIRIVNFRSIKDLSLDFNPRCRVLVGRNEAGKSNILRALSLLNPEIAFLHDDPRQIPHDESLSDESYIRYQFNFDEADQEAIMSRIGEKCLCSTMTMPILNSPSQAITLRDLYDKMAIGIYTVDIQKGERSGRFSVVSTSNMETCPGWFVPAKLGLDAAARLKQENTVLRTHQFKVAYEDAFDPNELKYLRPAKPEDFVRIVGSEIISHVEANLPETILWSYSPDNLIPARIKFSEFTTTPSLCQPLEHAFRLAGVEDIAAEVEKVRGRSNGIKNLLIRISTHSTKHIKDVWPEYGSLAVEMTMDGEYLVTTIKDKYNNFDLAQRSDGFKRFVSFLLMISAPTRTGKLTNVLLLIDDPDIGLHPTGTRHLRDELIRVSENNDVVYSSHSIFMIDGRALGRHLIVKKVNEITEVQTADNANYFDEEVIYNALGFSTFEMLKQKNIIFEGWRDKYLFVAAMKKLPKDMQPFKSLLDQVGLCHVQGVKDIRNLVPLLELAGRECIIVSDADRVAKEHQKYHRDGKMYGIWLSYDEIVDWGAITSEDFIDAKFYSGCLDEIKKLDPLLTSIRFSAPEVARIDVLSREITAAGVSPESKRILLNKVKEMLFDKIRPNHIDQRYYDCIKRLAEELMKSET